ncbi:2-keto-4-pentenoate hydratase [Streptomyces sp. CBMA123]|uniref:2-keto-4-pentenoate hydratase n=1 Tax=Streptomyces sp. CBMA123 TaxID=1896313 RepID=UPI0016621BB0|nr:fumarylacetoacetate hydrolase family protein [Streptomyces sp. CBMA123]MBD0693920.1 2-hydroxypenta-2,4-dienoate hydratase [Streptomyces sp. CBMA123]
MSDTGRNPRWLLNAAQGLRTAEQSGLATTPLSQLHPELTLEQAYRVQAAAIDRRLAGGGRLVGHKIGLTSTAMQEQMGVSEPDSGVLLENMVLPCGGAVRTAGLLAPRVEAEIGLRLGEDLAGPDVDGRRARAAVAEVFLALEVIDTRYGNWGITLEDSVADNASSARFAVGEPVAFHPDMDLGRIFVAVHVDNQLTCSGYGRDVLGDPVNALLWLARRLHGLGTGLHAGDIVLPGSVHASIPLLAGTRVEASSPRLPAVLLRAI